VFASFLIADIFSAELVFSLLGHQGSGNFHFVVDDCQWGRGARRFRGYGLRRPLPSTCTVVVRELIAALSVVIVHRPREAATRLLDLFAVQQDGSMNRNRTHMKPGHAHTAPLLICERLCHPHEIAPDESGHLENDHARELKLAYLQNQRRTAPCRADVCCSSRWRLGLYPDMIEQVEYLKVPEPGWLLP